MLLSCEFPDPLKAVDVSAIHKGSDPTSKRNYRPISVPSAMSKVFERLLVWRVRVQVELGPNNNYNLFSSDLCDVRSKTESFYKVY